MKRLSLLLLLVACSRSGPHKPLAVQVKGASSVSYAQVRPLFASYCAACHPSRSPPDWLDYNSAKSMVDNGRLLQRIATEKSMPPPGSPQAAAITDQDRNAIAAWAMSGGPLTAPKPGQPAPTQSVSEGIAARCFECHGAAGPGSDNQPKIPRLAGQNEAYLRWQLERFKWRERLDPTDAMNDVAYRLTAHEMDVICQYFSTSTVPHASPSLASYTSQAGLHLAEQYCNSCHLGPDGGTSDPLIPVLAGQSKQYLINQLLYFRTEERLSPLMHEFTKNLSNYDIEVLAQFFASSERSKSH